MDFCRNGTACIDPKNQQPTAQDKSYYRRAEADQILGEAFRTLYTMANAVSHKQSINHELARNSSYVKRPRKSRLAQEGPALQDGTGGV